ncbi:MAG: glycosyltransferase [Arenicellales bacterium]|jgi:MGT family glycosyltransferase|nr:glycosyltransferase [Arenicellales bacterium]MDP7563993.1 glycosyltransferase [Arenicellales bacterium]|tara:strand:+ start:923 stop:2215 length:1293 start_codon:yes stop_codon:yes gene_type:complete
MTGKTIAFFPEAAFGPALNSVGIAQACERLGHQAVFLTDPGMQGVYSGYGFEEHTVNMSEPMPPAEMAKYWTDFINGHIPNFDLSPYEQIDNYVKECWEAIVETAIWAEQELPGVLQRVQPDIVCVDNVILFPAIKRYAKKHGQPWVRIISCSENEIPDPDIPPHLSGCGENESACFVAYQERFNEVVGPIHQRFNAFLEECNEDPYPLGEFFEASPHMNLLLYPEPVKFKRATPLDPECFQYLEGCVRDESAFEVPAFKTNNETPLLYVSFGSLGAGDTTLLQRLMNAVANMPVRALFNVGDYQSEYDSVPDNIAIAPWYPQPSVISQADAVIHHGGNNSFNECLYFGKPALIMPYVWDGHDNARRVMETGHGLHLHRSRWTDQELTACIERMLTDQAMHEHLAKTSAHMRAEHGPTKAAAILNRLVEH